MRAMRGSPRRTIRFDSLIPVDRDANQWRANLYAAVNDALSFSQRSWNDRERGQTDLFGVAADPESGTDHPLPNVRPWTQAEMSQHEKAAVGFFLSVHPLDEHSETVDGLGIKPVADCSE